MSPMTAVAAAALLFGLAACASRGPTGPRRGGADDPRAAAVPGEARPGAERDLAPDSRRWVDSTLASLSLRERVAQLVMPWVGGDYVAVPSPELDRLLEWVTTQRVGGLVLSVGLPHSYAAKLNELQRRAPVPLLIASDMENGPGMRLGGIYSLPHLLAQGGGTEFPPVMAVGATGSNRLAEELGRVLGREARAVGVHLSFGPVLDVNSNPANPIINTRSFGEDPGLVASLGVAYIRGARDAGLMTTAKHFPGHGDTSQDSHLELPTIAADLDRLSAVELRPFRAAVDAGVDAIMTAHIAVQGVEGPEAPPATLSPRFMTELLRTELGFRGLLFTDAMDMGGVADAFGGGAEVLVRAIEAGADVLLMPPDVGAAIDAVVGAVERGRLSPTRIDESVRRVLAAKARAGLDRGRWVDLHRVSERVGVRAHTALAAEIAERSLVLARDRGDRVPLAPTARTLTLVYADAGNPVAGRVFLREIAAAGAIDTVRVDDRTTPAEWAALSQRARVADVVIAAIQVTPRQFDTPVEATGIAPLLESLAAGGVPVVMVSFGSPYLLSAIPSVPTYLLAWGAADASQRAAARALLGEIPITGRLPISLPPHHAAGEGIQRPAGTPPSAG